MTRKPPLGVGDLARAFELLRPQDDAARLAISEALGLRPVLTGDEARRPAAARPRRVDPTPAQRPPLDERTTRDPPDAPPPLPLPADLVSTVKGSSRELPSWMEQVTPLDRDPEPDQSRISWPSLFEPSWARGRLARLLATPAREGELDLDAAVDLLARQCWIASLPRREIPTLRRGACVLFDFGEAMQYFDRDRQQLAAELRDVVGADRLELLGFVGSPLQGVFREGETDVAPFEMPPAGTPILLVAELGQGRALLTSPGASPREWACFASLARAAECPLLAICPYGTERAAPSWADPGNVMLWDRVPWRRRPDRTSRVTDRRELPPETPAAVRILHRHSPAAIELATCLSPAARIEPELLRTARWRFVPEATAGVEVDLWFSALMSSRNPIAAVLYPEAAQWLRARLAADPERLAQVRQFLEDFRRKSESPHAVRVEEDLCFLALERPPDQASRAQRLLARVLKALTAEGEVYPEDERHGLALWAAAAIPQLDEELRSLPAARQLLLAARLHLATRALPDRDSDLPGNFGDSGWLFPADFPVTTLGIRLTDQGVELTEPPSAEATPLPGVPATFPRILRLRWQDESFETIRLASPGGRIVKPLQPGVLTIETLDGQQFELRPRAIASGQESELPGPAALAAGDGTSSNVRPVATLRDLVRSPSVKAAMESSLPAFLKEQRWFAGKARAVPAATIFDVVPLDEANPLAPGLALVQVDYEDAPRENYLLPIRLGGPDLPSERVIQSADPQLGLSGHVLDASDDPAFWQALFGTVVAQRSIPGEHGSLIASQEAAFLRRTTGDDVQWRPAIHPDAEKYRTADFGEQWSLHLLCRFHQGVDAELEIGRVLASREPRLAPLSAGAVEYRLSPGARISGLERPAAREEPWTLAILQEYVASRTDGWGYTLDVLDDFLDRVRSLTAGGDFRDAPPVRPGDSNPDRGGIPDPGELLPATSLLELTQRRPPPLVRRLLGRYLDWIERLGQRTAELHGSLASDSENPHFWRLPWDAVYRRNFAEKLAADTHRVLDRLAQSRESLAEDSRQAAGRVLAEQEGILKHCQSFAERSIAAERIRCHGDLHLGQVLLTADDQMLFRGMESRTHRPLAADRDRITPLYDAAGIVRSLHYATWAVTATHRRDDANREEIADALHPWRTVWYAWTAATYLRSYLSESRWARPPYLPSDRGQLAELWEICLLHLAMRELEYELAHRPAWVHIPLQAIEWNLRGLSLRSPAERRATVPVTGQTAPASASSPSPSGEGGSSDPDGIRLEPAESDNGVRMGDNPYRSNSDYTVFARFHVLAGTAPLVLLGIEELHFARGLGTLPLDPQLRINGEPQPLLSDDKTLQHPWELPALGVVVLEISRRFRPPLMNMCAADCDFGDLEIRVRFRIRNEVLSRSFLFELQERGRLRSIDRVREVPWFHDAHLADLRRAGKLTGEQYEVLRRYDAETRYRAAYSDNTSPNYLGVADAHRRILQSLTQDLPTYSLSRDDED